LTSFNESSVNLEDENLLNFVKIFPDENACGFIPKELMNWPKDVQQDKIKHKAKNNLY